jgi:hypothetical protein
LKHVLSNLLPRFGQGIDTFGSVEFVDAKSLAREPHRYLNLGIFDCLHVAV